MFWVYQISSVGSFPHVSVLPGGTWRRHRRRPVDGRINNGSLLFMTSWGYLLGYVDRISYVHETCILWHLGAREIWWAYLQISMSMGNMMINGWLLGVKLILWPSDGWKQQMIDFVFLLMPDVIRWWVLTMKFSLNNQTLRCYKQLGSVCCWVGLYKWLLYLWLACPNIGRTWENVKVLDTDTTPTLWNCFWTVIAGIAGNLSRGAQFFPENLNPVSWRD